ncbi:hypothetical protein BC829DRAFT_51976 [Chytridium lagenaria]|nr:hypothetical protein BC829DRAFT_51976 [Chytridium lagenaria]
MMVSYGIIALVTLLSVSVAAQNDPIPLPGPRPGPPRQPNQCYLMQRLPQPSESVTSFSACSSICSSRSLRYYGVFQVSDNNFRVIVQTPS